MLSKDMADGIGLSFVIEKLELSSYYGIEVVRDLNAAIYDFKALHSISSIDLAACHQNIFKLMKLHPSQILELQDVLSNFKNIKGTVKKLETSSLSEVDLFEIKRFLLGLDRLLKLQRRFDFHLDEIHFTQMTDPLNILDPTNQRIAVFSIHDGYYPALRAARQEKARIEALIDQHGMTDELINKRKEITSEEDKHEQAALKDLSGKLRPFVPIFKSNINSIGALDFTLAKAVLAKQTDAVCPKISPSDLKLVNMWNPKTKAELSKIGRTFTKTSIDLEPGATVLIGANMGGKSLTIKTVLLNVLLANMGFYVYADMAEVPVYDDVFFIEEGAGNDFLSSFGSEIVQLNKVVNHLAGKKLFITLDEPAKTTNPAEGAKIVRGIVTFFAKQKSTSLISTHYDHVQENAQTIYQTASFTYNGIENASLDSLANFIKYELRKVDKDTAIPTEAIKLCKVLGLSPALLEEIV